VAVVGMVADVVEVDFDQPAVTSAAEEALRKRAVEHSREDRKDVKAHGTVFRAPSGYASP